MNILKTGSDSAVELSCDKACSVLDGRTWAGQLSMMQDCIVFIDEGNEFVMSDEFSAAIQDTDNYYVIVTREGIPSLPYSVEEIYGIRNSGKYGTLRRTYNEFYHLYQAEVALELFAELPKQTFLTPVSSLYLS